jgi:hypothetical protein
MGDLFGEPLLDLQAAREQIDQPRQLAHPHHTTVGNVADVATTEERQQVVLAKAVQLDVAGDHHVVRLLDEDRLLDDLACASSIPAGEKVEGRCHTFRGC